jgi:hypothetical protein
MGTTSIREAYFCRHETGGFDIRRGDNVLNMRNSQLGAMKYPLALSHITQENDTIRVAIGSNQEMHGASAGRKYIRYSHGKGKKGSSKWDIAKMDKALLFVSEISHLLSTATNRFTAPQNIEVNSEGSSSREGRYKKNKNNNYERRLQKINRRKKEKEKY